MQQTDNGLSDFNANYTRLCKDNPSEMLDAMRELILEGKVTYQLAGDIFEYLGDEK